MDFEKKSVKTNHHLENPKKKSSMFVSKKATKTDRDRFNHHHPHDFRQSVDWQMLHLQHPGYHPNALHETYGGRMGQQGDLSMFPSPVFFFEGGETTKTEKCSNVPSCDDSSDIHVDFIWPKGISLP